MKNPVITNEELVGGVSESNDDAAQRNDAFRWENAYRELAQSRPLQKQKENRPREIEERRRDGSIGSFDNAASPMVSAYGQGEGLSGVGREIGDRKREEAALQIAHDELEAHAAYRTNDLTRINDGLRTEIAELKRSEAALRAAYAGLEQGAANRAEELTRVGDGLRTEIAELKKAAVQLQLTLDHSQTMLAATLKEIGSAVEMKNPFAAGHHSRSTALARTIARMMGLSGDEINAIRMAGFIHDIGKLSIPTEILAKPSQLSETEFPLVKEHPRKGYEVLKDVGFPWPLADIVHQHHERMDGSGYPRHLKGEEIRIEARILAVADVVEAMVSHRPYRPALGIEAALAEIERNSGTLYDSAVAGVCLQLFREKGFQFNEM